MSNLQDNTFHRVRCQDCDMKFMSDILTDDWLKVLYGKWISVDQVDLLESSIEVSAFYRTQRCIKHCIRFREMLTVPPDRSLSVLDFDCGDGNFLRTASLLGFEAVGIDFSEPRQTRNRRLGVVLLYSNLLELQDQHPAGERFDVITLFQVLEHLAEPLAVLKSLAEWIQPGGLSVLEVPDTRGCSDVPTTHEDHNLADPLEHINQFTPDTLSLMARQAGFTPVAPSVAYMSSQVKDVVKETVLGLVKRSPLRPLKKSTKEYSSK